MEIIVLLLILSVSLNIYLFNDKTKYISKGALKMLRIFCEYLDLFVFKNNDIKKGYKPLNWKKLNNFKIAIERAIKYTSMVDYFFQDLNDIGYYKLSPSFKSSIYSISAQMKGPSDADIRRLSEIIVKHFNKMIEEDNEQ